MYFPEETISDYAVDELPADVEVVKEDVIVLQDFDLERSDIDAVVSEINQSVNDAETLSKNALLIQEAIQNKRDDKVLLKRSIELRRSLERRYGGSCSIYATEAIVNGTDVVFALENEEGNQKNLFMRIIDKIVNAFKWLWKKITEIFSKKKGEDIDETAEDARKKAQEVESLPDEVKNKSPENIVAKGLITSYGYLGKDVKMEDIVSAVEAQGKLQPKLKAIVEFCGQSMSLLDQVIGEIEPTQGGSAITEQLKEINTRISESYGKLFSQFEKSTGSDLQKAGVLGENAKLPEEAWKLQGLPRGATFYIWVEETEKGPKTKCHLHTPEVDESTKIGDASVVHVYKVADASQLFVQEFNKGNDAFTAIAALGSKKTDSIGKSLTNLVSKAEGEAAASIGAAVSAAQDASFTLGKIITTLSTIRTNSYGSVLEAVKYIDNYMKAIAKAAHDAEKSTKEDNSAEKDK